MLYVFQLCERSNAAAHPIIIGSREEECHPDDVERRAKTLLWTHELERRQDIVIVRRKADDVEVYRRSIGSHPR